MEWAEFFRALRRRWVVVLLPALAGVGIGFLTTPGDAAAGDAPQEYEATHVLLVNTIDPSAGAPGNLGQSALLVTGGAVPDRAAARLAADGWEVDDPSALADQVTAEADDDTESIAITATDTNPDRAEAIADAFATGLRRHLAEQAGELRTDQIRTASRELERLRERLNNAEAHLAAAPNNPASLAQVDAASSDFRVASDELRTLRSQPIQTVALTTLDQAEAEPVHADGLTAPRSRAARMAIGGLLGLLLGAVVVFVAERFDDRILTAESAQEAFGLPVLAQIPAVPRRLRGEFLLLSHPSSAVAEAYRTLRSMLSFAFESGRSGSDRAPVLLVTSPGAGEAKSTTVTQVATAFAEVGEQVLVIDCDFRRPRLHQIFAVPSEPGLTDSLTDPDRAPSATLLARLRRPTDIDGISLVTSGPHTDIPAGTLPRVRELVELATQHADVVIIDTPPMLLANDAMELVHSADAVVLTARVGRTTLPSAARASELLSQLEVTAFGVVLVGTSVRTAGYGEYYGYRAASERRSWWRPWRRSEGNVATNGNGSGAPAPTGEVASAEKASASGSD